MFLDRLPDRGLVGDKVLVPASGPLGDHNSVIKFIDLICGLTPLQDLPDEQG